MTASIKRSPLQFPGRDADDGLAISHVCCIYGTASDCRLISDLDTGQDNGARADVKKWTPLIGQRGGDVKVKSDIVIMLPVRAVRCPRKPHSVSDLSGLSEADLILRLRRIVCETEFQSTIYRQNILRVDMTL